MNSIGVERTEVEQIIRKGMKWQDREHKNKWYANMHGCEVVFEVMEEIVYIITVYPEEAKK